MSTFVPKRRHVPQPVEAELGFLAALVLWKRQLLSTCTYPDWVFADEPCNQQPPRIAISRDSVALPGKNMITIMPKVA